LGGSASSRKIILDKDSSCRLARKRHRRAAKPLLMAKLHMKVDFIKKKLAAVKYGK